MENTVFLPGTMLEPPPVDSAMDLDYLDQLLLEGCWLETVDGSEFPYPGSSMSAPVFDPSYEWASSENNNTSSCIFQQNKQEERQNSVLLNGSTNSETQNSQSMAIVDRGCIPSPNFISKSSELNRSYWIGPMGNLGSTTSVMQRLMWALGHIKELTNDKDVLIQLWVPISQAGRRFLTTHEQPFSLETNCMRLANYREISVRYQFSAEEDSRDEAGLPGRVFLGKVPEWTPDVQFFKSDEYPRVDHAEQYGVRGTLALPVFEQSSRTCLGVIEVVMTTRKTKYRSDLESVCRALEAFDLRSSQILPPQNIKACNISYESALPEIQEVLRCACETHRLPLAQTWVSCIQQGKGGSRHSDENYIHCVSTVDQACYVSDPSIREFHEACSEHHLLKGQGVAGQAFTTNQPCFSPDINLNKKTEYPLSHHARIFGLCGAVAIRLRSINTGKVDYVLEFFLPTGCRDPEEQKKMLSSLSIIIQQVCQSLRVVTDKELEEETDFQICETVDDPSDSRRRRDNGLMVGTFSEKYSQENSSPEVCFSKAQENYNVSSRSEKQNNVSSEKLFELGQHDEEFLLKENFEHCGDSNSGEGSFSSMGMGKTVERRRSKAEKTITLQVLRQYFAGSLKDAAKSIGVCPTTLKRICRQHGIKRWPSRKIKKVGHSLQKLQVVIDSVQGASGALHIGSFYNNFPELASPDLPGTSPLSTSKPTNTSKRPKCMPQPEVINSVTQAAKSPQSSSCSQSSSSSHCYSSGTLQHSSALDAAASNEGPSNVVLKRVRSEAELKAPNQEPKVTPRSKSYKSLGTEAFPALAENGGNNPVEEVDARRVKVTFGEEKIRFRIQGGWKFKDLLQEVGRRFNISDMNMYDLKYLDDDFEWVLLTCDADLEECMDVCYRSSQNSTIKLSLQVSHHHLSLSERFSGRSVP